MSLVNYIKHLHLKRHKSMTSLIFALCTEDCQFTTKSVTTPQYNLHSILSSWPHKVLYHKTQFVIITLAVNVLVSNYAYKWKL